MLEELNISKATNVFGASKIEEQCVRI